MCLSQSKDGLSLLDPRQQQDTLQLRWLIPLLGDYQVDMETFSLSIDPASTEFASIVLPRLINFLVHHAPNLPDFRLPLLFPSLRPFALKNIDGCLSLSLRAMDLLPHCFASVVASAATCLSLPLSSIVTPETICRIPTSIRSLNVSHLYEHNADRDFCLKPIASRSHLLRYRTLCRRLHRLIGTNAVKFSHFFVRTFIPLAFARLGGHSFTPVIDHRRFDLTPFLSSFLLDAPIYQSLLTRSLYRKMCFPIPTSNAPLPVLSSKLW